MKVNQTTRNSGNTRPRSRLDERPACRLRTSADRRLLTLTPISQDDAYDHRRDQRVTSLHVGQRLPALRLRLLIHSAMACGA
jgi:hypothetical protein